MEFRGDADRTERVTRLQFSMGDLLLRRSNRDAASLEILKYDLGYVVYDVFFWKLCGLCFREKRVMCTFYLKK